MRDVLKSFDTVHSLLRLLYFLISKVVLSLCYRFRSAHPVLSNNRPAYTHIPVIWLGTLCRILNQRRNSLLTDRGQTCQRISTSCDRFANGSSRSRKNYHWPSAGAASA